MSTKYEEGTIVSTTSDGMYGNNWYAQTFLAISSHTVSSVKVKMYREGTITTLTASLRATDAGGQPTGADLVSGTLDVSTLSTNTNGVMTEITFSTPYTIISGVTYAIIIRLAGGNSSNEIRVRLDTSGGYTDGAKDFSNDAGASWTGLYNDLNFEVWGGPAALTDKTYSKKLVAAANDEIWYEDSAGSMIELAAANGDIDTSLPLQMFEAYGKIFIANKSNLKIADFVNVKLHTTDIVPADKTYPRHGTLIEATGGADSGAKMVVDYITVLDGDCYIYGQRITTATFLDTDVCTAVIDEGNVSFTLDANETAGPHWYNWAVYGNDTTFGELPDKATLGCLYRGRPVLSGNSDYPYQWYMGRQANPFDFAYTANDAQSAVAGGNSDAGEIGDIVTALIPYKDDYLIFGCTSSIWYLVGDPMSGGSINELDLTTGIFGAKSWCFDGEGNFYFWGINGIYKTSIPGTPKCISEIRLPAIIKDEDVDPSTHRITMGYDRRRAGIVISIITIADGTNSDYFYSLITGGFFPETYPEECAPFSQFYYATDDNDYSDLLFGCKDGYIRKFDDSAKDDDIGASDEAITSYVNFGPLPLADDPKFEGKITGLDCITAGGASGGSDSDNIECKLFLAKSAEEVAEKVIANSSPNLTKTIKAPGRQRGGSIKRKLRGVYAGIRLGNSTASETWGLEQLLIDIKKVGRFK